VACKNGNEDILNILIDKTEAQKLATLCISDTGLLPLHTLCRNKVEKYGIIKKILEKIIMSDTSSERALFDQVLKKEDSMKLPILHIAIENNHLMIVELLFRDYDITR
jgi:hypothetical protein